MLGNGNRYLTGVILVEMTAHGKMHVDNVGHWIDGSHVSYHSFHGTSHDFGMLRNIRSIVDGRFDE